MLAIFPVKASRTDACRAALEAVAEARERLAAAAAADGTPLAFIATLHVGRVVYGNIGSPDRLDFTVLGPAVNLVSRLEGLAKELDRPLLCSAAFAAAPKLSTSCLLIADMADEPSKRCFTFSVFTQPRPSGLDA